MGERERILLAEDDLPLRRSLVRLLESRGHAVVAQAGSLSDVRDIALNTGIVFGVAIIDGMLPKEGDGRIAAGVIRMERDVRIISYALDEQDFGDRNVTKFQGSRALLESLREV